MEKMACFWGLAEKKFFTSAWIFWGREREHYEEERSDEDKALFSPGHQAVQTADRMVEWRAGCKVQPQCHMGWLDPALLLPSKKHIQIAL